MSISDVSAQILQSLEYVRYNIYSYFLAIWQSSIIAKICIVLTFVWGCIKTVLTLFTSLCSAISSALTGFGFSGITVGGVNVLALANTVLPVDELVALVVTWFSLYAVCASIRFIRAAWAAIPFKAT